MTQLDPEKLAAAMIGGARKYIDAALSPIRERLEAAEARAAAAEQTIADMVAKAVAAIPLPVAEKGAPGIDGKDGQDGANGADGAPGPAGRGIAKLLIDVNGHLVATFTDGSTDDIGKVVGADGKDGADGRDGDPGERGAEGAAGQDGKSVDADDVADLIRAEVAKAGLPDMVERAVAALPPPRDGVDGKDGAPGQPGEKGERGMDGAPGRDGVDGAPGEKGMDGKDGRDGVDGKLPIVRAWADTVHREGEVVSHAGATWQALRDTGKEPPSADWVCLAAAGKPGRDAEQIEVIGTYDAERSYSRLNIVALNGHAFMARKNEPGPCPGEDWQVIAMRGKSGPPGEAGRQGEAGERGAPGPGLAALSIDGQGLLTARNADGSMVECDLYPVLAKVMN